MTPERLEKFTSELLKRGLTWKGDEIIRIRIEYFAGSHTVYFRFKGFGNAEAAYSLEQWIFDPEFELIECIQDAQNALRDSLIREFINDMIFKSLNNKPYLHYLVEALEGQEK